MSRSMRVNAVNTETFFMYMYYTPIVQLVTLELCSNLIDTISIFDIIAAFMKAEQVRQRTFTGESGKEYITGRQPIFFGGTADIFLGEQSGKRGKSYAIKEFLELAEIQQIAKNENTVLQRVSDIPGVIKRVDSNMSVKKPFLVTEYVSGRSAESLLAAPVSNVATVYADIADVLHELHQRDVLHLDVKPSNIIVSSQNTLSDFGSAVDQSDEAQSSYGVNITPHYFAPEGWDGILSPKIDVYASGVSLYESLLGDTPYSLTSNDVIGVYEQQKNASVPTFEEMLSKTKQRPMDHQLAALEGVVLTSLEKLSADRPSADEWAIMIREAIKSGQRKEELRPSHTEYKMKDTTTERIIFPN